MVLIPKSGVSVSTLLITQCIEAIAAKSEDLSVDPGTHNGETDFDRLSSDIHMHAVVHECSIPLPPRTHIKYMNIF